MTEIIKSVFCVHKRIDDPEGWYGKGDGMGVQDGEHVYTRGRCMLMYGKTNTICKVKKKKNNNK